MGPYLMTPSITNTIKENIVAILHFVTTARRFLRTSERHDSLQSQKATAHLRGLGQSVSLHLRLRKCDNNQQVQGCRPNRFLNDRFQTVSIKLVAWTVRSPRQKITSVSSRIKAGVCHCCHQGFLYADYLA